MSDAWIKKPEPGAWKLAVHSEELTAFKPLEVTLSGKSIVLYRKADGVAVALENRCPHRWAPLSDGSIDSDNIVCPYHGFKFCPQGHLVETSGRPKTPGVGSAAVYPVAEKSGEIWIAVEVNPTGV